MKQTNADDEQENPYSEMFKMTGRPVLFSRNECNDVADGLLGSRGQISSSMHILKLDITTTFSGGPDNLTCVVSSVYLDSSPAFTVTTKYDRFLTLLNSRSGLDDIWRNQSISNSKNQQLAVVTCDEGTTDYEPTFEMRTDTNFDFILNPQKDLSLRVINCYSTFCLLQITSNKCLFPKISEMGALPITPTSYITYRQKQMSMISVGVQNIIVSIQGYSNNIDVMGIEIIKGLETIKIAGSLIIICVNLQNLPCTQDEANYYGRKILTTLKTQSNIGDLFVEYKSVTKSETTDNMFLVNYHGYFYQGHEHDIIGKYKNDFRSCPKYTMSTGNDRFFYENNTVYDIKCVACPINTYYHEKSVLPDTSNTLKTMYIHNQDDGQSSDGTTTTYYTISPSSDTFPSDKQLYSEIIIEIGTILTLQVAPAFNDTQSISSVECEGQLLQHTRISNTEITIDITMELSGKIISVYIDNPLLPTGSQILTRPAYVLPRHSEITGSCETCPTNTFSGSYGTNHVSACENTKTHTTAARRLLSIDESKLTTMSPVTFIDIGNQLLFVLGIKDSTAHPESDFSIDVILQYDNLAFAKDNIAAIAKKVMQTYNYNNVPVEYKVRDIRLHASNAAVIFGIYGNYTNNTATNIKYHQELSIFGLSFLHSIIGLSVSGAIILIIIVIIIATSMKKQPLSHHTTQNEIVTNESGYCIVCQGEVAV